MSRPSLLARAVRAAVALVSHSRSGGVRAVAPLIAAAALACAAGNATAAEPADGGTDASGQAAVSADVEPVATLDPEWSANFVPPPIPRLGFRAATACRALDAVFYSPADWFRLAQKLRGNPSACAQYYVMVPAVTGDKTRFRLNETGRIHALGPQMHVIAEVNYAAWANWVGAGNGTFFDAGVEARKRMAAAGYDVTVGDVWGLNELSSAVRQGTGSARQNARDLIRGLYLGDGTGPPVQGVVWAVGLGQGTADLSTYKATLKAWLGDSAFWADVEPAVRFWSQEVYGDVRRWAVPGTDLATRRDRLVEYVEHFAVLAEAGPLADVEAFLRRTDTPNANAAWGYETNFGYTFVPSSQMQAFVAAQVYALRHYQGRAPWREADSFGFAWPPFTSPPFPFGLTGPQHTAQTATILDRLAEAIRASDVPNDEDPGIAACGPDAVWCAADIDGASFNPAWQILGTWTQPVATDSSATLNEDTAAAIPLVASDADGEPLTYTVLGEPTHGTLEGDGDSRTYTPAKNFTGSDSFTFRVNDGVMNSRVATVRIIVSPVNDAPVVEVSPAGPVSEGGAPVTLTAQASDVDGDDVALSWTTDLGTVVPAGAAAAFAADDGPATAHVTVTGDDGHGGTGRAVAEIEVRNVEPTAAIGAVPEALWGHPVSLIGSGLDVSVADAAAGLTASWDFGDGSPGAGGFAVSHTYTDPGTYTATLTVTDKDGGGGAATATVTVGYTSLIAGAATGPLRIASGTSVRLAEGAVLHGPVTVEPGGALDVAGATVDGSLRADGAAWVRLCGASVAGPFEAAAGAGPLLVGDGAAACGPTAFSGGVTLTENRAGVRIVGASVTGPLRVTGNVGGTTVTGNTIQGPLTVTGNADPVAHAPNTVHGPSTLQ